MSNTLHAQLFALRDEQYAAFIAKLIPTMDAQRIIGVRTPQLRALARQLRNTPQAEQLLHSLPHHYYEENQLHGFLVSQQRDFERALQLTQAFLPHVDNWATCDTFGPKVFKKHPERLCPHVLGWLQEKHLYTQRFAIWALMTFFMDQHFDAAHLKLVANHFSDEYYVNMMRAWYFATALTKQWDAALPILQQRLLDRWTHLKSIQKAVESRLIPDDRKALLRSLRY